MISNNICENISLELKYFLKVQYDIHDIICLIHNLNAKNERISITIFFSKTNSFNLFLNNNNILDNKQIYGCLNSNNIIEIEVKKILKKYSSSLKSPIYVIIKDHENEEKITILKMVCNQLSDKTYNNKDISLFLKKYAPISFHIYLNHLFILLGTQTLLSKLIDNDVLAFKKMLYQIVNSIDTNNIFNFESFNIYLDYLREPYCQYYFENDNNVKNAIVF